jgi:hypothetical protein
VKGDGGFVPGQGVGTGLVEITGGVRTVFVSQMEPSGSRPCCHVLAIGALEPQAQHVALAVEADAHGQVHGLELNT